jgi:hypothetical protein
LTVVQPDGTTLRSVNGSSYRASSTLVSVNRIELASDERTVMVEESLSRMYLATS